MKLSARKRTLSLLLGGAAVVSLVGLATRYRYPGARTTASETKVATGQASSSAAQPGGPSGTHEPGMGLPQFNPTAAFVSGPEAVDSTMAQWRKAILNKDVEAVERIDDVFRGAAGVFSEALQNSARKDTDPRVRAFSTRVLGNTKRKDAMPALRDCLGDESEHVRANAAWALLQVNDQESVARLGHMATHDLSQVVQRAAEDATQGLRQLAASDHSP